MVVGQLRGAQSSIDRSAAIHGKETSNLVVCVLARRLRARIERSGSRNPARERPPSQESKVGIPVGLELFGEGRQLGDRFSVVRAQGQSPSDGATVVLDRSVGTTVMTVSVRHFELPARLARDASKKHGEHGDDRDPSHDARTGPHGPHKKSLRRKISAAMKSVAPA